MKQPSPQTGVIIETKLAEVSPIPKVGVPVATSPRTLHHNSIHHNPSLPLSLMPSRTHEVSSGHGSVTVAPSSVTVAAVGSRGGSTSLRCPLQSPLQSPLQPPSLSGQSHIISIALSAMNEPTPPVVTSRQRRHSSGSSGRQFMSPLSSRCQAMTRSDPQVLLDKTQPMTKCVPPFDQSAQSVPDPIARPVLLDKTAQIEQSKRLGPPTQVDLTTQMDLHTHSPLHQQWTSSATMSSSAHVDHRLDHSPHGDCVLQYDQAAQLSLTSRSDCVDPTLHTSRLDRSSHSNRYNHTTCTELTDQATNRFDLTRCAERSSGRVAPPPQQQLPQPLTHQLAQESFSQRYYPPARNHQYETHSTHQHYSRSRYQQPIPPPVFPAQTISYVGDVRTNQSVSSRMPIVATAAAAAAVPMNQSTHIQYGHLTTYNHPQYSTPSGNTGNMSLVTQPPPNRLPTPIVTPQVVPSGIVLQWTLSAEELHKAQVVDRYELYAYQGNLSHSPLGSQPDPGWNKVGTVKALPLPMQCTLTQFMKARTYYFVIRAIDASGDHGTFSKRCTVNLP